MPVIDANGSQFDAARRPRAERSWDRNGWAKALHATAVSKRWWIIPDMSVPGHPTGYNASGRAEDHEQLRQRV